MVSTNASTENTLATSSPVSVPNSPTILTMNSNEQLININVVAQAPLKLDNTNYQSWRYQWETILTAYDFLHFIEQPPSSTATLFISDKTISFGVPLLPLYLLILFHLSLMPNLPMLSGKI
ncbi:hypothetical protein H5410_019542 [Solanum commersonii]|uniref:Retrotransposon Copia-like N-terminal domain-containing protein n=1 Tax=Solanum commersonii TaxID=4109 RepID=A0A9J5Z7P1_SOLCO|nr:hypothetical protein H5410_019542 [Solanum commersonii]